MIVESKDAIFKRLSDKCVRKVLSHEGTLMLVEFTFEKGGIGAPHHHDDHEQIGYVAKGSFEFTLGNETKIMRAGDTYYAPKGVTHGAVSLEDNSVLIDVFTPFREDFLAQSDQV